MKLIKFEYLDKKEQEKNKCLILNDQDTICIIPNKRPREKIIIKCNYPKLKIIKKCKS